MRSILPALSLAAAAIMAAMLAAPVLAQSSNVPPGNPCIKGNGNPCNANNGNIGKQGNASREIVRIDRKPPPTNVAMPPVLGRGAFVSQIGDANVASVIQTAPSAFAKVDQTGDRNETDVTQRGSGTGYIESKQTGDGNFARLQQSGAGHNVAYLSQNGNSNWAWAYQNANGGPHNGAMMTQTGDLNDMLLSQNGSDNRAILTQEGNGNGMTATQNGEGSRLTWKQQGNALSDLQITQTGGSEKGGQLLIIQTNR
jgi:hypothetical protein